MQSGKNDVAPLVLQGLLLGLGSELFEFEDFFKLSFAQCALFTHYSVGRPMIYLKVTPNLELKAFVSKMIEN